MTLNIHTEEDDQRQLIMSVEIPEKRVLQEMKAKARQLGRDINVPGFRRGKAPYHVIASRVGKEYLRKEAIEALIQPVYQEALAEVEPEIYAPASLDKIKDEPLTLTFTIPLTPKVDLGDYRSLRKEVEKVEISDKAVTEALEAVQERYVELEDVDRPAEKGDVVTIAGKGIALAKKAGEAAANDTDNEAETAAEDITLFNTKNLQIILDSDKVFPGTSFVENIVGMSVGDEKRFTITFPDDFEDEELRGKEANIELTLLQVQNRLVPLLDDNLAELEGYDSLELMREDTQETLQKAAERQAITDLIEGMVQDIREMATLVYPPAAVEAELDDRVAQLKERVKQAEWEWEDYLKIQGTTEENLREEFREAAINDVELQLILRQFALNEKIIVKQADIDAKIAERTESYGDNKELAAALNEYYQRDSVLREIESEIFIEKIYERMAAILSGNAPDLAELEAEAEEEVAETPAPEEDEEMDVETAVETQE